MRLLLVPAMLCLASLLQAQNPPPPPSSAPFRDKQLPHEPGFRVFLVPDMEGMGSAVDIHEVIAGNEGERYKELTSPDYWDRFRLLLTREVNATITGRAQCRGQELRGERRTRRQPVRQRASLGAGQLGASWCGAFPSRW